MKNNSRSKSPKFNDEEIKKENLEINSKPLIKKKTQSSEKNSS